MLQQNTLTGLQGGVESAVAPLAQVISDFHSHLDHVSRVRFQVPQDTEFCWFVSIDGDFMAFICKQSTKLVFDGG